MLNLMELSPDDFELVEKVKLFMVQHYEKKRHHVATVLRCSDGCLYFALHLDIQGFDVCAEPIALSNALLAGQHSFDLVVAVLYTENGPIVINPCGNCRQMFVQYAPDVCVVLLTQDGLKKAQAKDLLPCPY